MADTEEPATQERLVQLTNEANLAYSLKNYNDAAELYSRATEMQGQLRGDEMAPENAELLYLYGRCLYKVAVMKSDVLGGQVAGEKKAAPKSKSGGKPEHVKEEVDSPGQKQAEEIVAAVVEEKEAKITGTSEKKDTNQPFFQLVDAEWSDDEGDDAEDEGEDGGDAEAALEEEDDFATAYEILDLARVLLERQVQAAEQEEQDSTKGKGKAADVDMSPQLRQIRERLADTHDLQAEISLENERFADAITDFQSAADLKDQLHPKASSLIAEAHYKLSLALEFESMAAVRAAQAQEGGEGPAKVKVDEKPEVNEELRERARRETEVAVESIRLRIGEEEGRMAGLKVEAEMKAKKAEIEDVREILREMEDRLKELHAPAVTISAPGHNAPDDPMSGILGQILGESTAEQKARIEEATKNANDLSGLVKKKKPKVQPASTTNGAASDGANGSNKRKLEDDGEGEAKRAKTEELLGAA